MLFRTSAEQVEYLVAGLGNPGPEYERTRHNAGFLTADILAARHRFGKAKRGYDGRYAVGTFGGHGVCLLKPIVFMNRSGRSVAAALRAYRLGVERLVVVHDEIDLPFGQLRVRTGGGTAGHNGLKSLAELVGTDYHRVRIGVGRPASRDPDEVADYVLARFEEPESAVRDVIERAADAVEMLVAEGPHAAMHAFNPERD
jgi:peptidyl-tRNA hydrolase, PTH1 family